MTETAQYDASVIGVEVEVGEATVDEAHILAYCNAIGDMNPIFTDADAAAAGPNGGIIAPPAFVLTLPTERQGLDPKVVYGNTTFAADLSVPEYRSQILAITAIPEVGSIWLLSAVAALVGIARLCSHLIQKPSCAHYEFERVRSRGSGSGIRCGRVVDGL